MTTYTDCSEVYTIEGDEVSGPDPRVVMSIKEALWAGIDEEHLDEIFPLTHVPDAAASYPISQDWPNDNPDLLLDWPS